MGKGTFSGDDSKALRVWASSCSHVTTDILKGRESLVEAISDTERDPEFHWDIALHLGDLSGGQFPPGDEEGQEVVRQFASSTQHGREDFYNLLGNHDASGPNELCQWWFRKWVDPTGENSEFSGVHPDKRAHPVSGTWERYTFRVGNLLFIMMGDRNDGGPPVGRGAKGGYPAGAVTEETYHWWQQTVEENRDSIIITCHHNLLKETTVASGPWEGFRKNENGEWRPHYHGYFPDGGPEGASYLYFVGDKPDAQRFESYLQAHPGAIDMWWGGHTHTHPDDRTGGRSHIEKKWGVHFINVSALSKYHGSTNVPMSRHLTFRDGSDEVRVRCYLHTSDYAPKGWYHPAERVLKLSRPFER